MSLTPEQGRALRQAIDARREVLVHEIREDLERARRDSTEDIAGAAPDPGDESVADLIATLDQADASRDAGELREIEAARGRMDEGSYGECIDCGQDIGYPRLEAHPTALRCIRCQTVYEKTHASPEAPRL